MARLHTSVCYALGETGAIEDYSVLQTGLSVFGSGIGTGLSIYGCPKITGADKRGADRKSTAQKIIKANQVKQKEITDKKALRTELIKNIWKSLENKRLNYLMIKTL